MSNTILIQSFSHRWATAISLSSSTSSRTSAATSRSSTCSMSASSLQTAPSTVTRLRVAHDRDDGQKGQCNSDESHFADKLPSIIRWILKKWCGILVKINAKRETLYITDWRNCEQNKLLKKIINHFLSGWLSNCGRSLKIKCGLWNTSPGHV